MSDLKKQKLAVALSSNQDKEIKVPQVTATACGKLAEHLIMIAEENDIPLIEDEELAKDLSLIEVGGYLPEKLFPAVAELIAHIHFVAEKHKHK